MGDSGGYVAKTSSDADERMTLLYPRRHNRVAGLPGAGAGQELAIRPERSILTGVMRGVR